MIRTLIASSVLCLCSLWTSTVPAQENGIEGHWRGTAPATGQDVELRLDLKMESGNLTGTMDIAESRLLSFSIPNIQFTSTKLHFDVPANWGLAMFRDIGLPPEQEVIVFDGELKNETLTGTLRLSNFSTPITLKHGYPTLPYRQEEVRFQNGSVSLAGTLIVPQTKGPHPVVVFTHGSGDRTRTAHFYEADILARHGIASLRYDKRGAGGSTGANWEVATLEELAGDALAGVNFLLTRKDIDHRQIGMFGLSQGTWLIVMDAARSKDVAFLISVSGSGIPVWEQEIFRASSIMRLRGFSEQEINDARAFIKEQFEVARTGLGWQALDAKMKDLREKTKWFSDYISEYRSLSSARFWWLAAFSYDPTGDLEKTRVPVLTLLGENDLSFPVTEVQARMERAFNTAGNHDYVFKVFPKAEHQIMVPQEMNGQAFRRVVTPDYMKTMVDWVTKHVRIPY